METFRDIIAWAVALSGIVGAVIFFPQLKRLIEVKNSTPFSLVSAWGSAAIQIITLFHALLQQDWHLTVLMSTYATLQMTFIYLIYRYRVESGGGHGKT